MNDEKSGRITISVPKYQREYLIMLKKADINFNTSKFYRERVDEYMNLVSDSIVKTIQIAGLQTEIKELKEKLRKLEEAEMETNRQIKKREEDIVVMSKSMKAIVKEQELEQAEKKMKVTIYHMSTSPSDDILTELERMGIVDILKRHERTLTIADIDEMKKDLRW